MQKEAHLNLVVSTTRNHCPIGETVGQINRKMSRRPVLSCEGACIRGEIARQAANMVAKHEGYGRACHGELFAVPESAIANWVKAADKVVLIDGCFLRCHGRILENLLSEVQLVQFDALSLYGKYTNIFDPDDVPEVERLEVARQVAEWVITNLSKEGGASCSLQSCSLDSWCCGSDTLGCGEKNC